MRSLSLRPGGSLTIPKMALSMGFRSSVSLLPAIQATGLLAVAPKGLTPSERVSLRWTHQLGGALHLRRILREYLAYYHSCRTHLSLEKDSPEPRKVESPDQGKVVEFPMVGGLHHLYARLAA